MKNSLAARIEMATGLSVAGANGHYALSGMFNRYRPDGVGLERIFCGVDIEGEVFARIKRVFEVTSRGGDARDSYFVVRAPAHVSEERTREIANAYLRGFQLLAEHSDNTELFAELQGFTVASRLPIVAERNEDLQAMMYECITDLLATQQPEDDELFILKEALYSMCNDYFLAAYVLWPAMRAEGKLRSAFDAYFDLWQYDIELEYFKGVVVASQRAR